MSAELLPIEFEKAIAAFNKSDIPREYMMDMLIGWYRNASTYPHREKEVKEFIKAINVLSK